MGEMELQRRLVSVQLLDIFYRKYWHIYKAYEDIYKKKQAVSKIQSYIFRK